jgi:hypothetical protein
MPDLTTLADVKAWMKITGTAEDAELSRLITAASSGIEKYLGRQLELADYVEERHGRGGNRLALNEGPVVSVQSVVINGFTIPKSTGPFVPGWVNDDKAVFLRGYYAFEHGIKNVVVRYEAGFDEVPGSVAQACIELVSLRHKERDRIGIVSKGIAGETVSFTQKDFTNSVRTALDEFRRVAVPLQ